MILIASYLVSGVGLSLHKACWNVHLLDPSPSQEAQAQAVGRTYRLGQAHDVRVVGYCVTGSYNECMVNTAIIAISLIFASQELVINTGAELLELNC